MTHPREYHLLVVICTMGLALCGCGADDEGREPQASQQAHASPAHEAQAPTSAGPTDAGPASPAEADKMTAGSGESLTPMDQGRLAEAVQAEELKALLPNSLDGMGQSTASAERNQTMGIDMTIAQASYESADNGSVTITMTDAGGLTGPMRMGLAGWALVEYDRETATGYERTTTYGGYKAMEEYDKQDNSSGVRVFVADRFLVEVEGQNVVIETLRQALEKVDLKKIAHLASGS